MGLTIILACVLILTGIARSTLPLSALPLPEKWRSQVVDSMAYADEDEFSLALDAAGNPHMAYNAINTGSVYDPYERSPILRLASWNGLAWNKQTIDSDNTSKIRLSSLEFDSVNRAHVVYVSQVVYPDGGLIKYACMTGSNWSIQTVDTGARPAIAIDSSDNPHIVYAGENGLLKYANWNGINWTIQNVDPQSSRPPMLINHGIGADQYLALDSNDRPFIIYSVGSTVKLAVGNQSGWTIREVVLNQSVQLGNIVLDSLGNPHFTYVVEQTYELMYARWDGSDWVIQKLSNVWDGFNLRCSRIALDSKDNPHITFVGLLFTVFYARWTGSEWRFQDAARPLFVKFAVPLVLDSRGNPHIGYLDSGSSHYPYDNIALNYVTINQPTPPSTPAPEPSPSSSPTITPPSTNTPTPPLSPSPTLEPTLEPTLTPSPSAENNPAQDFTLPIAIATMTVIAVAAIVLVYVKKQRRN